MMFELILVTVPLTVSPPWINTSPSTVRSLGMVISKVLLPFIHASVPDPITSCLSPPILSG